MKILTSEIRNLVGNLFFTAWFIKKDGSIREMTCRLGVTKHLKGGNMTHSPEELNHLVVYDVKTKGYRTINANTLLKIKVNGILYDLVENKIIT